MKRGPHLILLLIAIMFLTQYATEVMADNPSCPVIKMEVERLADLNIPRSGHMLFCAGGEMVIAGGHTSGFVPTPTAEYYSQGQWHLMQMTYPHDYGLAVVLKSGKVLLAGGMESPHGIGQSFGAEFSILISLLIVVLPSNVLLKDWFL